MHYWQKKLFENKFNKDQKDFIVSKMKLLHATFLFELVSPRYQIVVHYPEEKLILHDIILLNGPIISPNTVRLAAGELDIPMVKKYDLSKDELEKAQSELKDVEGFVIKFKSGHILKIKKTEDYFTKSKM